MSAADRQPPWVTGYLWGVGTTLLGLLGPPIHWTASALALGMALVAAWVRDGRVAALALALGVAPLWTAASSSPSGGLPLVVALGSTAILASSRGGPLSPLPWILLVIGLATGARQVAAGLALDAALGTAAPLALAGLTLAGAVSGAHRSRAKILCLALAGLFGLAQAGWAALRPPTRDAEVDRDHALGVLALHVPSLAQAPNLGLEALRVDPELHGLALALLPVVGPDALLDAGWRPEGATLDAEQRLDLAWRLDGRGEGGRAIRVLRPGRSEPRVAWSLELLRRCQGTPGTFDGPAPAGTPTLPGQIGLSWAFLQNGTKSLDFQAAAPLVGLRLELRGTPYQGQPAVWASLDDGAATRLETDETPGWKTISAALTPGPHRLTVRFDDDAFGPDGDRNAWVLGLASP